MVQPPVGGFAGVLVHGFGCQCSFVIAKGEGEALGRTVDPKKTTWNVGGFAGYALCDRERSEDCASRWLLGLGRS